MPKKKVWNEKMEILGRDEVESVRIRKLRKQLKYCYTHSEFYKRKFDQVGFLPEDIKTWEDYRKIPPLMNKDDERESQRESIGRLGHPYGIHLCCPLEKIVVAKTTGGTLGFPPSVIPLPSMTSIDGMKEGPRVLALGPPTRRPRPLLLSPKWRMGGEYRQISTPFHGNTLLGYRRRLRWKRSLKMRRSLGLTS